MDRGEKVSSLDDMNSAAIEINLHRFVFGNGEDLPPTAFIWEEAEVHLSNSLMEKMTPEERGEE